MKSRSFPEGSTGHDIIDEVVVKNQSRNQTVFEQAQDYPPYFGGTNVGEHKTQLKPIRNRNKLGKQRLICDIIEGTRNFKLDPGVARISLVEDGVISKNIEVSPTIIKLIKTCVACSYNANEDFSIVVTAFIHAVIETAEYPNLPLTLPCNNKTQKLVAAELNEFIKEIYDEEGIKYYEVVETKRSKKKGNPLLEAAEKARV